MLERNIKELGFFHGSRVNTAYETHTLASACLLCSNCLGSDCFYNTLYFVNGFLKSSYSYLLLQVLYGWQIIFNHLSSVLWAFWTITGVPTL